MLPEFQPLRINGVCQPHENVQPVRAVHPHIETLLAYGTAKQVVVGRRGFHLSLSQEIRDANQALIGKPDHARYPFVLAEEIIDVVLPQFCGRFPVIVELVKEPLGFVLGTAVDDHQMSALHPASRIDQGRGLTPMGIAQHGFMQRCDGEIEFVLLTHDASPVRL